MVGFIFVWTEESSIGLLWVCVWAFWWFRVILGLCLGVFFLIDFS